MVIDLNNTHPFYEADQALRVKARDLFSGAEVVLSATNVETYLLKSDNESTALYTIRKARAVYDNWVAGVINARQALLWRKAPTRNLPGPLDALLDNVNRKRDSADTFFWRVAQNAQVEGLWWVLVDKPRVAAIPVSAAEEQSMGIRPFFEAIEPDRVLDWAVGDDRALLWAVVARDVSKYDEAEGGRQPGQEDEAVAERVTWTRSEWIVYREAENAGYVEVDRGTHGLGAVPLVPFYGEYKDDFRGRPVVADILPHCINLLNKFSDRDMAEFMVCNAIPYVISQDNPGELTAGAMKGMFIKAVEGAQCEIGYLEPSGNGISACRESERDLIRRIAEIALRQAKTDTAQAQAADSLKEEKREFSAGLAPASRMYQSGETECWRLAGLWLNQRNLDPEIAYNQDFDDDRIGADMVPTTHAGGRGQSVAPHAARDSR